MLFKVPIFNTQKLFYSFCFSPFNENKEWEKDESLKTQWEKTISFVFQYENLFFLLIISVCWNHWLENFVKMFGNSVFWTRKMFSLSSCREFFWIFKFTIKVSFHFIFEKWFEKYPRTYFAMGSGLTGYYLCQSSEILIFGKKTIQTLRYLMISLDSVRLKHWGRS